MSTHWGNQQLYFKAGAYIQDHHGPSSEGSKVTFYGARQQASLIPRLR
ncbi:polysaccharide lyase family 7 protein [Pseudomonas sp. SG20056]|nr:polysaccharide lyase family 7 protein [Pseudomonas sp. SG20056]WNF48683.1 polysaccharide lyase family 7 protein [Pseudomonas sp. SG20056]